MQESARKLAGRLKWSTTLRKERAIREDAYKSLANCYKKMMERMWHRVGQNGVKTPTLVFSFDKSDATATIYFEDKANGRRSHVLAMGDPSNIKGGGLLQDLNRKESLPYFISDEIIVSTAIASILSDKGNATEAESQKVLSEYYATEPYNPLDLSKVWMSRLNSTMCSLWQMAPIMKRTMEIAEDRKLKPTIAQKIAMEEVEIPELPPCLNSDNGDGRINMSYPGSLFYTIDHHGIAVCKEYPNEYLDLSDYSAMKSIASTIYRDITGNKDLNDIGISGALFLIEEEPVWNGGNRFPWETASSKRFAVNFDDGEATHMVNIFDSLEDARACLEREVKAFAEGTNEFYSRFPSMNEDGDIVADFELIQIDEEGNFDEYIEFWNAKDGFHKPQ